jgi:hypothetical protein
LFIDATMSTTGLSEALIADGWRVQLHKDRYPSQGEKADHRWIPEVTSEGYAVITSDKSMQSWNAEGGKVRAAIESSGAKVFFLKGVPTEQVAAIRKASHSIARHCKQCAGTYFVARIHGPGSRLGEVQTLRQGGKNRNERKYGVGIRNRPDDDGTAA